MRDHVSGIEVPAPVGRYVETAYADGVPGVGTAAMEGSGRFRQRPLPWLPFTNAIGSRPGMDRVSDMFVGLGPITVMKALDAFVGGRGITMFPSSADTGPRVDQGVATVRSGHDPRAHLGPLGRRARPVDQAAVRAGHRRARPRRAPAPAPRSRLRAGSRRSRP